MPFYDDPHVFYDDPAIFYDDLGLGYTPGFPQLNLTSVSIGKKSMEYWEVTKDRAQMSRTVWNQYAAAATVGSLGLADLTGYIAAFEPAAQDRTAAQDEFDARDRAVNTALLMMKILGTKVPQIIDGHLGGDEGIRRDLDDVFAIAPRFEGSILARARTLYPVWVRANAALAALAPPAPAITKAIGGVPQTAAMLKALLDGYTGLTQTRDDKASMLRQKQTDLRKIDRKTDRLNKDWYQVRKATAEPGSDEAVALDQIPTEQGTPAPVQIDIHDLLQGGTDGLHVLVSYEQGGGEHATTREVQWMVAGVDADFTHTTPLDASGNALGPFAVGKVVKVRTSVSNSSGTRTSAIRTITLATPIL